MKRLFALYFMSWWLPACLFLASLGGFVATALGGPSFVQFSSMFFILAGGAFLGLVSTFLVHLVAARWGRALLAFLLILGSGFGTFSAFGFLMFASLFGPSEDGFADNLTIPEDMVVAEPVPDATKPWSGQAPEGSDPFQASIRAALSIPGSDDRTIVPSMPSLRRASTEHAAELLAYVESSPDWHVFMERGNRFAARRWSYGGEPRNTLHGYVSDFRGDTRFQTRCLLCLDRQQWSRYPVQIVSEGTQPVTPEKEEGNQLHESRVMVDCGGVWVEIFEQSDAPERRVTKATLRNLEEEFARFLEGPVTAVALARTRSLDLARHLADEDGHALQLYEGMQPGIYGVIYTLNPGEPGTVYLKAYEVTKQAPLSVDRLRSRSKTRMAWSSDSSERFGTKAGFTIYEGDWDQPYAARFEAWFIPDAGGEERKLAERVFRIEGWQR